MTLATVRGVQGRYAASDSACQSLGRAGQAACARACNAENRGLRGEVDAARLEFQNLLAASTGNADMQAWLLVSLAELETRSGNPTVAENHYRSALALAPDDYARLGLVDVLLDNGRPAQALALTDAMPRNDAVLVRRAIAAKRAGAPSASSDAEELRERFDQTAQREQLQSARDTAVRRHAREQAMFALWVEERADLALVLARENASWQREPFDVLLLAHAARTSGPAQALREAHQLQLDMGLHDVRISSIR